MNIIYYTDNQLEPKLASLVREQLLKAGLPIISVSLEPIDFGYNIYLPLERGYLTMFKQILAGLEESKSDVIFFAEHDVLYHPSHFDFTPTEDVVYYNTNTWNTDWEHCLHYNSKRTSQICARREVLLKHYRKRVELVEKNGFSRKMGFEPGTHTRKERVDDLTSDTWVSEFPNIDIKHGRNLTPARWRKDQFRNQKFTEGWEESTIDKVPGWDLLKIKEELCTQKI